MATCESCTHNNVCKYGENRSNGMYCTGEKCRQHTPTANVVEVVRCKDCKWWHTDGCAFRKDAVKDLPAADDFCSHGERKE